jgi:MFS family permease
MQVFMSYLINFVERTLGITDYVIPLGIIIVCSALIAGVLGFFMDKLGKKHFYYPVMVLLVLSTLGLYLIKFAPAGGMMPMLYVFAIVLMACSLAMGGLFSAAFSDYIPKGREGCFQGVKMFFIVLVPMVFGPLIAQGVNNTYGTYAFNELSGQNDLFVYPFELFMAAAIIAAFAIIPAFFVRKDSVRLRNMLILERDKQKEALDGLSTDTDAESEAAPV